MGDNTRLFESADFTELLLRHMANSPEVLEKAKDYKLEATDFMVDDHVGIKIYREFARILLDMGKAPVDRDLFFTLMKIALKDGTLSKDDTENVGKLCDFVFNDTSPLTPEFILERLSQFIRYRRVLKVKARNKDDLDKLVLEYNEINRELQSVDLINTTRVFVPFETIAKRPERYNYVQTGFTQIDAIIGGHCKGELAYMIGYNGQGKTATMMNMARSAARLNHRVTIITLEEAPENLCNRLYSAEFRIPHQELHHSDPAALAQLEVRFAEMTEATKRALMNIQIIDAGDVEPTPEGIGRLLEQRAKETGFYPDEVFIDQFELLEPNIRRVKGEDLWRTQLRIAEDLFKLSKMKLNGEWPIAWWVLHQANGDVKVRFNRSDVSGYKGIIRRATLAVGLGRDLADPSFINLFSMKARNTAEFSWDFKTHLEYMDIEHSGVLSNYIAAEAKKKSGGGNPTAKAKISTPTPTPATAPTLVT